MRARSSLLMAVAALALVAGPATAQSPTASTAPAASSAATAFGPAWTSVPCDTFEVNEKAAAIADCGYVTVKENRAKGTDTTIQVGVVRLRSTSTDPGTPLIVGTGGPGGAGLDFLSKGLFATGFDWAGLWAPILADRDVVRFTQRGTQFAKPFLGCKEYDNLDYEAALNGWSREQLDAQITATLTACRDKLAADGVDLSGYNSDENAADIVDIKNALGYDKIAYYGESYGTLLGQFLLRNHPEILESIVLDGIAPATPTLYSEMVDVNAALQRAVDACNAQASCKAQYGDLGTALADLVAKLDKDPVKLTRKAADGTDETLTLNSTNALGWLFIKLYSGGADLPKLLTDTLKDPQSTAAQWAPSPEAEATFGRMQHFAINCADDANASMDEFKLDQLPAWLRAFAYDDGVRELLACQALGVPRLSDASDALVTSDLPALLLNGGLDPATAAENGHIVEKGLPNSQYILFPAGGHIQSKDPCAVRMIASFLKDPKTPLDTSCITPAGQFITFEPTTVKNADGSASLTITLTRPAWTDKADGVYAFQGGAVELHIAVLPPTTTPDQAVKDALKELTVVEDSQIKDGDTLAGLPTRAASVDVDANGAKVAGDAWAFSTPTATYVVSLFTPLGDQARALYPQILSTIAVDPAP